MKRAELKLFTALRSGISTLILLAVGVMSASCQPNALTARANELAVGATAKQPSNSAATATDSTSQSTVSSGTDSTPPKSSGAGATTPISGSDQTGIKSKTPSTTRGSEAVSTAATESDTTPEDDTVYIPINPVESYNFLTKAKILELRSNHAAKFPQLLSGEYKPSDRVFMQIEDGKPWWGIRGIFVNGAGEKSIEGEAEESRFLSNPFLLVAASPWTCEIWNTKAVPEAALSDIDFPYCWLPSTLTYHPKNSLVEVTYDISDYDKKLADRKDWLNERERNELPIRTFGLVGYNARDFGYEYLYVAVDQSTNIANVGEPGEPVEIGQFIHCGGGSGYPGGCNNQSPGRPPLDQMKILKLPATAKILLWKTKPSSKLDKPDMTVLMKLE
ncbi:MAG: hypothetical protein SGJ27_19490 [Candidatus Melainabacteria bacterium]|nr:hypothetical protein [Candidatus Melainabacteria bacterium]